jgi:hypothetical protein
MEGFETLRIIVERDDAEVLSQELRATLTTADVSIDGSEPTTPAPPRLGRDHTLHSSVVQMAVIAVTGTGFVGAVSKVLIERIRATRRGVVIVTADGASIDINGGFEAQEVEAIIARALAQSAAPREQA